VDKSAEPAIRAAWKPQAGAIEETPNSSSASGAEVASPELAVFASTRGEDDGGGAHDVELDVQIG
jgi:hypothetical protein